MPLEPKGYTPTWAKPIEELEQTTRARLSCNHSYDKGWLKGLHVKSSFVEPVPPLFVALQGPQGIGKTSLTSSLQDALHSAAQRKGPPTSPFQADAGLTRRPKVAVLSLDDFYLPHSAMLTLTRASHTVTVSSEEESSPQPNKLLSGRGLPGTHDLPLLASALSIISRINNPVSPSQSTTTPEAPALSNVQSQTFPSVVTPKYDKSAFAGEGDRDMEFNTLSGPIDVVVLEGWCMGFHPVSKSVLQSIWDRVSGVAELAPNSALDAGGGPAKLEVPEAELERAVIKRLGITIADVAQINHYLHEYLDKIYPFFTGGFIQLLPPPTQPHSLIYEWRLEQEKGMKAHNGGRGMTDDEVERFVDRYIPGYVFFRGGVTNGLANEDGTENKVDTTTEADLEHLVTAQSAVARTPWAGRGLRLTLDAQRDLVIPSLLTEMTSDTITRRTSQSAALLRRVGMIVHPPDVD